MNNDKEELMKESKFSQEDIDKQKPGGLIKFISFLLSLIIIALLLGPIGYWYYKTQVKGEKFSLKELIYGKKEEVIIRDNEEEKNKPQEENKEVVKESIEVVDYKDKAKDNCPNPKYETLINASEENFVIDFDIKKVYDEDGNVSYSYSLKSGQNVIYENKSKEKPCINAYKYNGLYLVDFTKGNNKVLYLFNQEGLLIKTIGDTDVSKISTVVINDNEIVETIKNNVDSNYSECSFNQSEEYKNIMITNNYNVNNNSVEKTSSITRYCK